MVYDPVGALPIEQGYLLSDQAQGQVAGAVQGSQEKELFSGQLAWASMGQSGNAHQAVSDQLTSAGAD